MKAGGGAEETSGRKSGGSATREESRAAGSGSRQKSPKSGERFLFRSLSFSEGGLEVGFNGMARRGFGEEVCEG